MASLVTSVNIIVNKQSDQRILTTVIEVLGDKFVDKKIDLTFYQLIEDWTSFSAMLESNPNLVFRNCQLGKKNRDELLYSDIFPSEIISRSESVILNQVRLILEPTSHSHHSWTQKLSV
jgi:hypothetical protein